MAKVINVKPGDSEYYSMDHEDGTSWIDIVVDANTIDSSFVNQPLLKSDDRITVYEVYSELGGGDTGIPQLGFAIWTAVSVWIGLAVAKGFFQEFGKEGAQLILQSIKRPKSITNINVSSQNAEIYIIVPAGLSDPESDKLAVLIDELTTKNQLQGKVYITFDRETEKLIIMGQPEST